MNDTFAPYDATSLPAVVLAYLDAHDEGRHADVRATFTPDATVVDDGRTYDGIDQIGAWIERAASEYTYTSTRIGQAVEDADNVVVQIRLDGNFPGGTATLRYRFRLASDRITHLVIEV